MGTLQTNILRINKHQRKNMKLMSDIMSFFWPFSGTKKKKKCPAYKRYKRKNFLHLQERAESRHVTKAFEDMILQHLQNKSLAKKDDPNEQKHLQTSKQWNLATNKRTFNDFHN